MNNTNIKDSNIPLTTELLVKNGFKYHSYSNVYGTIIYYEFPVESINRRGFYIEYTPETKDFHITDHVLISIKTVQEFLNVLECCHLHELVVNFKY